MALISRYIASSAVQKVLLLIGSVVIGIALGLMITYVQVKFVKEVAKDYIGRVSAIRYSLTYACAPIVSFLLSVAYQAAAVETDFVFIFNRRSNMFRVYNYLSFCFCAYGCTLQKL